jgi:hypothetical protein
VHKPRARKDGKKAKVEVEVKVKVKVEILLD